LLWKKPALAKKLIVFIFKCVEYKNQNARILGGVNFPSLAEQPLTGNRIGYGW
jgi:hypothetical protein